MAYPGRPTGFCDFGCAKARALLNEEVLRESLEPQLEVIRLEHACLNPSCLKVQICRCWPIGLKRQLESPSVKHVRQQENDSRSTFDFRPKVTPD